MQVESNLFRQNNYIYKLYKPLNFFFTGVHIAKKINKIGMWSSDTVQIFLEDVRVPAKNIIGQEGLGFYYQMLQVRRIALDFIIP